MFDVVGGAYEEYCKEPHWAQVFGSGGRAAAALGTLAGRVTLHTYVSPRTAPVVEALAVSFGFDVRVYPSRVAPRFEYLHGLSTPAIYPDPSLLKAAEPFTVTGDHVLRFGMLEGNARVEARNAVYDPQNPEDPRPFQENGSSAKRLAVVVNRTEGAKLTRKRLPDDIGRELLRRAEASVVVVKLGPYGALICERAGRTRVSAHATPSVFPIGSGDVFSAVFAYLWAERHQTAKRAAQLASLATAHYCRTTVLPISIDAARGAKYCQLPPAKRRLHRPLVYLAGPFFDIAQRWLVDETRRALIQQGVRVFSPIHDVGRGAAEDIAPADLHGLRRCDVVLALVDGLDSGTLFEVGYARALQRPVVALCQRESQEALKMLAGSNCLITSDFVTAIFLAVWSTMR